MNKIFEIIGGVTVLIFMSVVLWQLTHTSTSLEEQRFACPADAQQCPNGSYVGRSGPDCSFTPCPLDEVGEGPEQTDEDFGPSVPQTPEQETDPDPVGEPVACTMDAKQCPDGSFVGRVGPNCEFEACPSSETPSKIITKCSPESKLAEACTMDYSPVCGLVQIQCITTPCDPIEETFSNGCVACAQGNVDSYTEGTCESL